MELQRIREKVWSGEVLSDDELSALRRAAQNEGGPMWRTTVAQALINADAVSAAIPLLEAVRRDFPRDVQANLALARALISVEKWNEAEAPLNQALALNPGDPEPMKALATLALRRAEWSRARALVQDVLKVDPLDEEAQFLWSEFQRLAPAELTAGPTVDEFTRVLLEKLKAQSTPYVVAKGQLIIKLGRGGVARFELEALFRESVRLGRDLSESAELVARDFAERSLGLPPGKLQLLSRVLPVLRDSAFLARGDGLARREGPAGLWVFYVVENPDSLLYVPEGLTAVHHVSLEQLDEAAWKNLEARPTEVRAVELVDGGLRLANASTGVWALAAGDGHDATRLLTVSHQAALEKTCGRVPLVVYLGLRELVLCCREDDQPSVQKLEALESAREGIGGTWRFSEGRLSSRS